MNKREKILVVSVIILIFMVLSYFSFFKLNTYLSEQQKKEQISQELILAQQKNFKETQQQISELRKKINDQNETLKKNIVSNQSKSASSVNEITASNLKPYLTGIGIIFCDLGNGNAVTGSGSLWMFGNQGYVLTNEHVVAPQIINSNCMFAIDGLNTDDPSIGDYTIYPREGKNWNSQTDASILILHNRNIGVKSTSVEKLNYSISSLPDCSSNISLGSPVTIIGYPASTEISGTDNFNNDTFTFSRTVTNGVVSAYETTVMDQADSNLPFPNYFVSNKIDHGNSGGIALSKYNDSLCVLGIPTWLNQGISDNQGIVQNIKNVMYVNK